jgi:hypothetical protein
MGIIFTDWLLKTRKYLTTVSPPVFGPLWRWYSEDLVYSKRDKGVLTGMISELLRYCTPVKRGVNLILSLLMVCVMIWHGWYRRSCWGRFLFWVVFVGLFNLAGLLTYLGLNHTPVIRCGFCGKQRGLETVDCPRCKAELAVPEQRDVDLIMAV